MCRYRFRYRIFLCEIENFIFSKIEKPGYLNIEYPGFNL